MEKSLRVNPATVTLQCNVMTLHNCVWVEIVEMSLKITTVKHERLTRLYGTCYTECECKCAPCRVRAIRRGCGLEQAGVGDRHCV